jgi:hypothetical protein
VPRTISVMMGSHWVLSSFPPVQGTTPMGSACAEGHLAIVVLLLEAGADVEKESYVRGYEHTATFV